CSSGVFILSTDVLCVFEVKSQYIFCFKKVCLI
ncbi:MAG: hypothetical protein ACI8X3_001869, partial [Saprospiraceae bacterium]